MCGLERNGCGCDRYQVTRRFWKPPLGVQARLDAARVQGADVHLSGDDAVNRPTRVRARSHRDNESPHESKSGRPLIGRLSEWTGRRRRAEPEAV